MSDIKKIDSTLQPFSTYEKEVKEDDEAEVSTLQTENFNQMLQLQVLNVEQNPNTPPPKIADLRVMIHLMTLLIEMVDVLNLAMLSVTARLKFETKFQQAYSFEISNFEVFLQIPEDQRNYTGVGGKSSDQQQKRYDLNSVFNVNLQDKERANKDIHADNAKEVQSLQNQIQDSTSRLIDFLKSFLEETKSLTRILFS